MAVDPFRSFYTAQGREQGHTDTVHQGLINQSLCYDNDRSQQSTGIPTMLHNSTGSSH